eukprot:g19534.t1
MSLSDHDGLIQREPGTGGAPKLIVYYCLMYMLHRQQRCQLTPCTILYQLCKGKKTALARCLASVALANGGCFDCSA